MVLNLGWVVFCGLLTFCGLFIIADLVGSGVMCFTCLLCVNALFLGLVVCYVCFVIYVGCLWLCVALWIFMCFLRVHFVEFWVSLYWLGCYMVCCGCCWIWWIVGFFTWLKAGFWVLLFCI